MVLHGKGQRAQDTTTIGDITYVRPAGNASGWGGRQWIYFPDDRYTEVRDSIARAIDGAGCRSVVIQGFSNGASAAAKLYCRGERFGDRVKGYIIDDPVPDHGVDSCAPAANMHVRLYWTGALTVAIDGWSCAAQDWTCDGGQTIGIEKYARALGTDIKTSMQTTHKEYVTPPEQAEWLAEGQ